MYTDNNPLVYVRESKLGMAQTRWLSEFALFGFDIKYRTGKSNKAVDALSHCPFVQEEMESASDSEECESISYATVCKELEDIIDWEFLPIKCRVAIQKKHNKPAKQEQELHSSVVEVLNKVSPSEMNDAQQADPTISQVVQLGKARNRPKLSQIQKVK